MGVAVEADRKLGRKSPEWMRRTAEMVKSGSHGVTLVIHDGQVEVTPDDVGEDPAPAADRQSPDHGATTEDRAETRPATAMTDEVAALRGIMAPIGKPGHPSTPVDMGLDGFEVAAGLVLTYRDTSGDLVPLTTVQMAEQRRAWLAEQAAEQHLEDESRTAQ